MNHNVDAKFSVSPSRHRTVLIKMLGPYLLKTRRAWIKNARSQIEKLDLDETEKNRLFQAYRRCRIWMRKRRLQALSLHNWHRSKALACLFHTQKMMRFASKQPKRDLLQFYLTM